MTFILGLTGSIGMGKTTTSAIFRRRGVWMHDADACVHRLYRGAAVPLIDAAFPGAVRDGVVDRGVLSALVLGAPSRIKELETIVHPLVREARERLLRDARAVKAPLALLDVPLLFETGGDEDCDAVVVVTAPAALQSERVLARAGMTIAKFAAIRAKQMPDAEKRCRAHFLVDTGRGLGAAEAQVDDILRALAGRPGRVAIPTG